MNDHPPVNGHPWARVRGSVEVRLRVRALGYRGT